MSRHAYDHHQSPGDFIVRVYPEIPRLAENAFWVRDFGDDIMGDHILGEFNRGASHYIGDDEYFGEDCDICKKSKAVGYDDFFGNYCPRCYITHPLRYKQRNVNPWTGG